MYLKGFTQLRIAAELGTTRDIVKYDLSIIKAQWLERTMQAFDERKAEEDARLCHIEQEAWDAWERSKEPKRRSETRVNRGGGYMGTDYTETVAGYDTSTGDARFLLIALKAVDRRIKLWGLDEPDKSISMSLELVKVYSGDLDLDAI